MKKEYFKPEAEVLMISPVSLLAQSSSQEIKPDGPGGRPRTKESRGEWGNVWK